MIYKSRNIIVTMDDKGIIISTRRGIFRVKWDEVKIRWNDVANAAVVIEKNILRIRIKIPLPPTGQHRLPFPVSLFWPDPYVDINLSAFTEKETKALLEEMIILLEAHTPNRFDLLRKSTKELLSMSEND